VERANPPASADGTRLQLQLPADRRVVRPLRQFVGDLCRAGGMSARATREVRLAVTEVFENAVEHGASGASPVSVRITIKERTLHFTLTESRPTSERAWKAMQRKIASNAEPVREFEAARGWGLRLVASFVDRFRTTRIRGGQVRVSFVKHG